MANSSADALRAGRSGAISWRAAIAIAAIGVAAVVVAYIPALRAGWIWDDNHYVTDNIHLHTLHGLWRLWTRPGAVPQYYPLTHTTFWIEYHLWKIHPFGYHLDNVLLHIANAAMAGLILRRLGVAGCWLAAALFALHPVQVESVAWVTERKNVLSGFLYLSAMWMALDVWAIAPRAHGHGLKFWQSYFFCLGLFILSLLSKSVTASFPVIVLLLIGWKRGRITWRQVGSLAPFLVLGAAMGTLTAWMEHHVVGAAGPEFTWSAPQRILIAGRAVWFYLGKLLWPHPLIFIYPKWNLDAGSALQWLFPVGVAVVLAGMILMRRLVGRPVIMAALFFVITLFPALGFVSVYPMRYSFVADHFQYLASIGPIALAAAALSRVGWPTSAALLFILGLLTWGQAGVYANSQSVWRDVVAKDGKSAIGHCNLGLELHEQGGAELRRALELDPTFVEAWIGLGGIAEARQQWDQAREYDEAAAIAAPDNPKPRWRLGLLDRRQGREETARGEFEFAARHLPDPAPAFEQLGEMDVDQNRLDAAAAEFALALKGNPDKATACNNLGVVAALQGQPDQAAEYFARALAIDPDFAAARENLAKLAR